MKVQHRAAFATLAALSCAGVLQAATIEDFRFNEADGTVITGAANNANPGNGWLSQNTSIDATSQNGVFRIQKGSESTPVTGQVSNALDIANVTAGKVWLMARISGWNYSAVASSPLERVRFGFLDNDPPLAGSSTIAAEMTIDRVSDTGLVLSSDALGTGAIADATDLPLALSRSTPLRLALELDKDADTYSVYYKDGNAPFLLLGSGELGASTLNSGDRDGNGVRFAFTGTFLESEGEFFDVDRIWVTDVNPIPEPGSATILAVMVFGAIGLRRRAA